MRLPSILKGKDVPKHLAISATRVTEWAKKKGKEFTVASDKNIQLVKEMIDLQIKKDIPVLTIQLSTINDDEIKGIAKLIKILRNEELIKNKKIRVFVVGNWYGLHPDLTDDIRSIIEETKEYDNYFLNLCINYDGQKEILAALRFLIKKAEVEKIKPDELTPENIKESISTSYFIPPDLIVESGGRFSGILLWDSKGASMYYTNKYWLDIDKNDLDKAFQFYNNNKKSEN